MADGSGVVWFGASGLEVLGDHDDGVEVTIEVQTTATVVACAACGTRARPKDRRWVTLRDAPLADRAVRIRWHKRVWACPDADCEVRTWTETHELAEARRVLTRRAGRWAADRVAAVEGTPASIARGFAVAWSTVWVAVARIGHAAIDDEDRVGPAPMIGFDETVMSPSSRRRRRRFITAVVDVATSQILDVFEGRDAADLRAWMAQMPASWLAQVEVVSVDPHEGYRSAVVRPDHANFASRAARPPIAQRSPSEVGERYCKAFDAARVWPAVGSNEFDEVDRMGHSGLSGALIQRPRRKHE